MRAPPCSNKLAGRGAGWCPPRESLRMKSFLPVWSLSFPHRVFLPAWSLFFVSSRGVFSLCHPAWSLFFVSSRPESAERRDPGFRPRPLPPSFGRSRRARFLVSVFALCVILERSEESRILASPYQEEAAPPAWARVQIPNSATSASLCHPERSEGSRLTFRRPAPITQTSPVSERQHPRRSRA